MGMFSKKTKKDETSVSTESQDLSKTSEASKPTKQKKSKTTLRVKNDKSKGSSFWVVDTKGGEETILFSGTIMECQSYIYLASRNLML
jgi:hypothetical protein